MIIASDATREAEAIKQPAQLPKRNVGIGLSPKYSGEQPLGATHRSSSIVEVSLDCHYPQVDSGRQTGKVAMRAVCRLSEE